MDFLSVCKQVLKALDDSNVHFALIGGFAMGLRGAARTTVDIDLLLLLEDVDTAKEILSKYGYRIVYETDNVLQFSADERYGSIDVILSYREISRSMLARAGRIAVADDVEMPVLLREDIIGLKVQALNNDPRRQVQDWADIRALADAARVEGETLDWTLLEDFFQLFEKADLFEELQREFQG